MGVVRGHFPFWVFSSFLFLTMHLWCSNLHMHFLQPAEICLKNTWLYRVSSPPVFTVLFWAAFEGFSANFICFFWCFGLGKKLLYFSSKLCDLFGISIKEGAQEIPILGRVVWFQLEKCCFGFYPKCTNASNSSKIFFSIFRSIQMLFWL